MKDLRIIFVDQLSLDNSVLDGINPNDVLLFYEPINTFYAVSYTHLTLPTTPYV